MAIPQVQRTKRAAPASDFFDPPEQAAKRTRQLAFNSHSAKAMGHNFDIPSVITRIRTRTDEPFNAGRALGMMHYHIVPLVSTHLENAVDFCNKDPTALTWATGFVEAVDQYIAYLRLRDGCSEMFPSDVTVNRKRRRMRRKYMERYVYLVENVYKEHVREQLCDVFQSWSKEQTQLFNKGVDKALSGIQRVVYPQENVVLKARDDEWAIWLRGKCEELGMVEARAGRRALEEV